MTQESLDTTRRDNDELKSRMADLQSQMDKLQRLIELKNNQLAKMQAEGATRWARSGATETGNPSRRPSWPRTRRRQRPKTGRRLPLLLRRPRRHTAEKPACHARGIRRKAN